MGIRALILVLETQHTKFAVKAREKNLNALEDQSANGTVTTTSNSIISDTATFFTAVSMLFKLSFGCSKVDDIHLSEVILTRKSFLLLALLYSFPALLGFMVLLLASPQYALCYDCGIFLQLPIVAVSANIFSNNF